PRPDAVLMRLARSRRGYALAKDGGHPELAGACTFPSGAEGPWRCLSLGVLDLRQPRCTSEESCIRKAAAERGSAPGPVGLADATGEDEAATGRAFALM